MPGAWTGLEGGRHLLLQVRGSGCPRCESQIPVSPRTVQLAKLISRVPQGFESWGSRAPDGCPSFASLSADVYMSQNLYAYLGTELAL